MGSWNAMMDEHGLIDERVASLHATGLAPSEIDERMNLEPGTAHDVMVARWRFEKIYGTVRHG